MSQFIEQTKFLESSANELKDLACSEYDLHDDVTGDLTKFIAEMPEEEEMTIKQWIEHCAANLKILLLSHVQKLMILFLKNMIVQLK